MTLIIGQGLRIEYTTHKGFSDLGLKNIWELEMVHDQSRKEHSALIILGQIGNVILFVFILIHIWTPRDHSYGHSLKIMFFYFDDLQNVALGVRFVRTTTLVWLKLKAHKRTCLRLIFLRSWLALGERANLILTHFNFYFELRKQHSL
ncbi:hypothetical protein ACJX0J_010243 [Zea mays]